MRHFIVTERYAGDLQRVMLVRVTGSIRCTWLCEVSLAFRVEPACAWYTFQGCDSLPISDKLTQLSQEEEADDGKEVTWGTRDHPYQHGLF